MATALPIELRERIVVAYFNQRMPIAKIAVVFQVGVTTVRRYITMTANGLALHPRTAPGAKPKLREEDLVWLRD